jgi:molecular chaperone GrpE (heat shock protein)
VAGAFQPVIDGDQGRHTLATVGVQEALKRLQESQKKNQASGVKKALKDLLNLVDVLEKP